MSDSQTKQETGRLITPFFRLSFPQLFQPRAVVAGQEPKYSISMLFPKVFTPEWCALFKTTPTEQQRLMDLLKKATFEAAVAKWGPEKAKWPKPFQSPWHDGAVDVKDYDGYDKDTIYISASSKIKPGLRDSKMQEIIETGDIYGGCYCRASVTVFAYDNVKKGVSFGLRNVQKVRDGEPFGGASKPEDDFAPIEAPAAQPATAGVGVTAAPTADPLGF